MCFSGNKNCVFPWFHCEKLILSTPKVITSFAPQVLNTCLLMKLTTIVHVIVVSKETGLAAHAQTFHASRTIWILGKWRLQLSHLIRRFVSFCRWDNKAAFIRAFLTTALRSTVLKPYLWNYKLQPFLTTESEKAKPILSATLGSLFPTNQ